jgi:translation initiation factor 2D
MQPFHLVTLPGKDPILKKGAPKTIEVLQEIRQGRKTVTKLTGMESFGLEIDDLCKELTKLCASSATRKSSSPSTPCLSSNDVSLILLLDNQIHGTSPKAPLYEIMVQGPQIKHVSELLLRKGVPKKFIMVNDKTAKGKGRK